MDLMWELVTRTIQVANSLHSTNVKLVRFLNNNIGAAHSMANTSQTPTTKSTNYSFFSFLLSFRRSSKLKAMKGRWKKQYNFFVHFVKQHFFITSKGVPIINGRTMAWNWKWHLVCSNENEKKKDFGLRFF